MNIKLIEHIVAFTAWCFACKWFMLCPHHSKQQTFTRNRWQNDLGHLWQPQVHLGKKPEVHWKLTSICCWLDLIHLRSMVSAEKEISTSRWTSPGSFSQAASTYNHQMFLISLCGSTSHQFNAHRNTYLVSLFLQECHIMHAFMIWGFFFYLLELFVCRVTESVITSWIKKSVIIKKKGIKDRRGNKGERRVGRKAPL